MKHVHPQADQSNCLKHHDVTHDMSCHTFTVLYNAHSQLDLSDREKCFIIKHRCLDLLISNVNLRKMNELDNLLYSCMF